MTSKKAHFTKAPAKYVMRTLRETAEVLAEAHKKVDQKTRKIYLFPDPKGEVIRLVEVTQTVPASGGPIPFSFAPALAQNINYPLTVILLNPREWNKVGTGKIKLPKGFDKIKPVEI